MTLTACPIFRPASSGLSRSLLSSATRVPPASTASLATQRPASSSTAPKVYRAFVSSSPKGFAVQDPHHVPFHGMPRFMKGRAFNPSLVSQADVW